MYDEYEQNLNGWIFAYIRVYMTFERTCINFALTLIKLQGCRVSMGWSPCDCLYKYVWMCIFWEHGHEWIFDLKEFDFDFDRACRGCTIGFAVSFHICVSTGCNILMHGPASSFNYGFIDSCLGFERGLKHKRLSLVNALRNEYVQVGAWSSLVWFDKFFKPNLKK